MFVWQAYANKAVVKPPNELKLKSIHLTFSISKFKSIYSGVYHTTIITMYKTAKIPKRLKIANPDKSFFKQYGKRNKFNNTI